MNPKNIEAALRPLDSARVSGRRSRELSLRGLQDSGSTAKVTTADIEELAIGYKVLLVKGSYSRTLWNTVWVITQIAGDLAHVSADNRQPQWFPRLHLRQFEKVKKPLFFFTKGRAGL
jgi:hypothetical protein